MASTILILAVALLCGAFAWRLLRTPPSTVQNLSDWEVEKYEVDVEVLRNLLDRREERYLRTQLSRSQFNLFERERIRLTMNMLKMIEANAAMLMRLGQLAKMNGAGDGNLSERADELIMAALQLRWDLQLLKLCLMIKLLIPGWNVTLPKLETRYQELMRCLTGIKQLHRPVFP